MPSLEERYRRADWDLKLISAASALLELDDPQEGIVLHCIRGWHHITYGTATVEHLRSSLPLSDKRIEKYLSLLRRRGWIARDGDYLALTDKGRAEERRIKGTRASEFKKYLRNLNKDGN